MCKVLESSLVAPQFLVHRKPFSDGIKMGSVVGYFAMCSDLVKDF